MFFKRSKPKPHKPAITVEPSYIARDTTIEGNVLSDGEVHVDGAVNGLVRAHTCLVDARGEVRGDIFAEFVYVRGRVHGTISGVHVQIEAGAHVEGDVVNETISIANGAFVLGSIRHNPPARKTTQESLVKLDGLLTETLAKDNIRLFKSSK